MIQIQKTKDKVILSLTTELDYEDVQDLVLDLQSWLIENQPLPKFTGISEEKIKEAWDYSKSKAYIEAKEQNDSKNKLASDMRRCFVDLLDSEWIQKELTTYELDPKDRAIIVKKTKLKDERKKR
jgi:hypothetical protein